MWTFLVMRLSRDKVTIFHPSQAELKMAFKHIGEEKGAVKIPWIIKQISSLHQITLFAFTRTHTHTHTRKACSDLVWNKYLLALTIKAEWYEEHLIHQCMLGCSENAYQMWPSKVLGVFYLVPGFRPVWGKNWLMSCSDQADLDTIWTTIVTYRTLKSKREVPCKTRRLQD